MIYHAVSPYDEVDEKEFARKWEARQSWDILYEQGVLPCHYTKFKRSAKDIGDPRNLPYLRDILEYAINQAKDDDIIFYTNDDNYLQAELPGILSHHCGRYASCTSHRNGFHVGRDLFAATKRWWRENWEGVPDAIIGCSEYDLHMACFIRLQKGIRSNEGNLGRAITPAEIQRGYVKHVDHVARWTQREYIDTSGQKHNRKLFYDWAKVHLPELKFNGRMQLCVK